MTWKVDRMPVLIVAEILGAESDTLIEHAMVPDNAGRPDHHAGAVVDCEIFADGCRRVYVDACGAVSHFGQHPRNPGNAQQIELVGHPVVQHHRHKRVAQNHFPNVRDCRIIVQHSLDIRVEQPCDLRQGADETVGEVCPQFGSRSHLAVQDVPDGFRTVRPGRYRGIVGEYYVLHKVHHPCKFLYAWRFVHDFNSRFQVIVLKITGSGIL